MGSLRAEDELRIGSYALERKLGAGGMAEVYLARRTGPHGFTKKVAIKRILPELSDDSQLIQMFCDEARVAASLSHPNIIQIHEFGEHEGELYIVMEYVDGVSCSALLRAVNAKGEAIPVGPSLYVVREVLLALGFAHEAKDEHDRSLGIVHRDVSPSNVLVSRTGSVKLIDFGITRSLLGERRTRPGELKGKLRYMSPEQILGGDVDARSDLFAVGILLAEMLSGRALFAGGTDLEILTRITRGELGLVREGKLPGDLATLLETALAHRPKDRFQSAREFARAVEDLATARGIRLDDTVIVPYLHELGVLPGSGTRPVAREEPIALVVPTRVKPPVPRDRRRVPPLPPSAKRRLGPPELPRAVPRVVETTEGECRLRTRSGALVGPVSRAEVLALLATGRLSSRSSISMDGAPFVRASAVPAFSALAAHPAFRFREDDEMSPEWLARLDTTALPGALFRIASQRRTGLLVAVDGKRRKRVFFDRGDPVFVASTDRDELLGRRLVASGTISERALELAVAKGPSTRLGEALVGLGVLRPAQLVRELSSQLEDRLLELGRWRIGELRFFPGRTLGTEYHQRTREPTLSLLTRLVREEYAPGDIASLLRPFIKEPVSLGPGYRTLSPLLGLGPDEAKTLVVAETGSPIREVVTQATQSGMAMADALRAVFVGLSAGLLRVTGWPPSPGSTPTFADE